MDLRKKCALWALSIATMVAHAHADDPLIKGGCFTLEEYHKQQVALQMSGFAVLEGNSVFLPVLKEDYRFVLNTYKFGDNQRMLMTVRDAPEKRNPGKACIMFFSEESRGVLGDINPGTPVAKPWIEGGDLQAIRAMCTNKTLPKMIELDNQKVKEVGGAWMT